MGTIVIIEWGGCEREKKLFLPHPPSAGLTSIVELSKMLRIFVQSALFLHGWLFSGFAFAKATLY